MTPKHAADLARMQAINDQYAHQQAMMQAQAMQNAYQGIGQVTAPVGVHPQSGTAGQVLATSSTIPGWINTLGQVATGSLIGGQAMPIPFPPQPTVWPHPAQVQTFWMKINGKDRLLPFPQPGQILYCEDDNPRWLYEHEIPRPTMSPPMFSLEEINEYA